MFTTTTYFLYVQKMKYLKKYSQALVYTLGLFLFFSICIDLSFEINYISVNSGDDYRKINDSTVAIVLGAAVYGNKPSPVLNHRLKSALTLYKKRKVKKILLSGDNGTRSYNELKPMLNYMLKNKVKKEDIFVDNSGFRTLDTLLRAKYIFQIKDAVIVTQRFHQPRAAFIAEKIGIKVSCFESDVGEYKDETKNRFREFFARNLAWIDMNLMQEVTYTGKSYPITGDGTETWKLRDIPLE